MKNKMFYVFGTIEYVTSNKDGLVTQGYYHSKRYDGHVQLQGKPNHAWFHPLEIFRWYRFGKWAVKHPKTYKFIFSKLKTFYVKRIL